MERLSADVRLRATLWLALGAAGISFSPVLVKLLDNQALGLTAIGFWRTAIGGAFLLVIAVVAREKLIISRRVLLWSALAGFFFFIDLFAWHRSIVLAGSGMATMLGNTQVFGTAVLSFFIFKERLSLSFLLSSLVAMIGVALLVGIGSGGVDFNSSYLKGVFYGLLTGLAYSHYIVSLKKAGTQPEEPSIVIMMAAVSIISATFLGIGSIFEEAPFMPANGMTWLLLVALGVFVQALSWLLIVNSFKQLETHRAALVLLLQPILAMVWGYIFFDELLTAGQILGALITLSAIYVGSMRGATVTKQTLKLLKKSGITK